MFFPMIVTLVLSPVVPRREAWAVLRQPGDYGRMGRSDQKIRSAILADDSEATLTAESRSITSQDPRAIGTTTIDPRHLSGFGTFTKGIHQQPGTGRRLCVFCSESSGNSTPQQNLWLGLPIRATSRG